MMRIVVVSVCEPRLKMQAQSQANLPPKTQRRRLTNQKPEPRPTSAPRTSRNSIAPSVQRLSDRRATPVVRRSLPCTTALECHCCLLLLGTACCLYDLLQAHFFRSVAVSSTAVPWLARVPLLLKLRSSVVSQQRCASNRRAVLSTK